jgi:hypothetical protein
LGAGRFSQEKDSGEDEEESEDAEEDAGYDHGMLLDVATRLSVRHVDCGGQWLAS